MIWPNALAGRGLAASALVRALLLVRVKYTSPLSGLTAPHSGRSILVAPATSAARRVLISTSPWSAKLTPAALQAFWNFLSLRSSASHSPLPLASKRATYSVPSSSKRPLLRPGRYRSEEHTSELQSQSNLVC